MEKQHQKKTHAWFFYITAIIFSVSATTITLASHYLWSNHLIIGAGVLVTLFLSAFLISYKLHKISQKSPTHSQQKENAERPITSDETIKDWQLKDSRIILLTADTLDQHPIIPHLASWQIEAKLCSNTLRAFTEILSASDNNKPYETVIVDQHQLNISPIQFAELIYSEPSLKDTSLIYLSSENNTSYNQQLIAGGYSHVLQNPINKSLLYNALHKTTDAEYENPSQNITSFINRYTDEQSSLPPLDILIAANPEHLKLIRQILKTTKHRIFAVINGEQALNALDSHNFDIAIFELEMPIISGIEAIKLYRFTHQKSKWMPFIALAPSANPQAINECNKLDIDACLIGEIQHHTLLAAIKQAITQQDDAIPSTAPKHKTTNTADLNLHNSQILGRATLQDLEELGSGEEFVHNLINNFLLNSEKLLCGMKRSIAENRYQSFIDYAFAFKDSAGNLGALAVYKASIKASHLEHADFKNNAEMLFNGIELSLKKTHKALLDYMKEERSSIHNH